MTTCWIVLAVSILAVCPDTCSSMSLQAASRKERGGGPMSLPQRTIGHQYIQLGMSHYNWTKYLGQVDDFLVMYKQRPEKNNICGMRLSHSFALWAIVRELKPDVIVESGINTGHSTYVLRAAAPNAHIISLDPLPAPMAHCGSETRWLNQRNNEYMTGAGFADFASINWTQKLGENKTALVFFDDHQNAYSRVPILKKHGFHYAVFEDNYPLGEGNLGGNSLKQVFSTVDDRATYLANTLETYEEVPPLFDYLPPNFKYPGHKACVLDRLTSAEFGAPLIQPDKSSAEKQLFEKFEKSLGIDMQHNYEEFMMYCNIAIVSL